MTVLQRLPKRIGTKSRECDISEDKEENCFQKYGRIVTSNATDKRLR